MNKLSDISNNVVLERLLLPTFERAGVEVAVLRLDKTDDYISGNKWFKLRYHLQEAVNQQKLGLLSVGGAHSNHLHALAAAGKRFGLQTVGLIRGSALDTPTIRDLKQLGMTLHWLSYGEYRRRYQQAFWQEWEKHYPDYYLVPEGGSGVLGAKGCQIIPTLIKQQLLTIGWDDFDCIYVSVGTGSTLAGILWGKEVRHDVVGCLAIPESYGVDKQIEALLKEIPLEKARYQLYVATRKGFGQADIDLLTFMEDVESQTGLCLDPVYTGKTLYFLYQQVMDNQISKGTRIVLIHTGGLQGRRVLIEH